MNEITNVRAFFNERHITLNSGWEDDAIGYVKSQLRGNYDNLKLCKAVFLQWLDSDLRESTQPTLNVPENAIGITIVKPVLVQLTSILNISESYYSQYRSKIMDITQDNSEFRDPSETSHEHEKPKVGIVPPKKPPFYMYKLSDGNITIKAVVGESVNGLDCNTPIGAKLLLIPKFICRYRVLKLTSTNCQLLGGFNEQCIDKDDPLSKLLSKIETTGNRPLPASVRPQSVPSVSTPAHIPPTQSRPPSLPTLPPVRDVIQQTPPIRSIPQPSTSIPHSSLPSKEAVQKTPHVKVVVQKKLPTKEVVQKTEEEEIEVITIPPSPPPAKRSRIDHDPTPSKIIDQSIDTSDAINVESVETDNQLFNLFSQTENAENIPPPSVHGSETTIQPSPSIPSNEVVVKTEVKEEEDLEIIAIHQSPPPSKKARIVDDPSPSDSSLITKFKELKLIKISQALQLMKFSIGSKKVKITAYMLEILEPFQIVDGEWTMKIRLKDETCDDLNCFISHQLLCNLIGMTPDEAMAIRRSSNFGKRKEGTERIKTLDVQLQRLDLIFEIEFFAANRATPRIIGLETFTDALELC